LLGLWLAHEVNLGAGGTEESCKCALHLLGCGLGASGSPKGFLPRHAARLQQPHAGIQGALTRRGGCALRCLHGRASGIALPPALLALWAKPQAAKPLKTTEKLLDELYDCQAALQAAGREIVKLRAELGLNPAYIEGKVKP
jgi:hypothetical protein